MMSIFSLASGVIFLVLKDPLPDIGSHELQPVVFSADYSFSGIRADIKQTLILIIDKRMLYLAPQILWAGMSLAIFTGLLGVQISDSVQEDASNNEKLKKTMLAMISLGFGEIFGSLSIG
jgi:hypothetical protein